ncbi:MAG: diguanylate cyclase [Anaerolineae bacterium]|nr:diguanylate cyclase [Anaerolineae bacterium]
MTWYQRFKDVVPLGLVVGYALALVLLGSVLVLYRLPEQFMIVMVVPIVLAALRYPRAVYLAMVGLLTLGALIITWFLSRDWSASLLTVTVIIFTLLLTTEMIYRLEHLQRQSHLRLRESEERYRLLVENQGEGVALVDAQENFVFVNPAAEQIFGVGTGELQGKNLRAFTTPAQFSTLQEQSKRCQAGEKTTYEVQITRPNGQERTLLVTATPYCDAQGQFLGAFSVFRDITGRKRGEQALARRDAILDAVALAAERFLRTLSWRDHIADVMQSLGRATQVSRITIYENQWEADGTLLWYQRYAWTPAESAMAHLLEERAIQPIAVGWARWLPDLERGKWIRGNVRDFPPNEQALLAAQGIRSIIIVPIFAQSTWWGLMELDDCQQERTWSSAEIDALVTACDTLGAAIGREWIDIELRKRAHHLELLNKITDAAIAAPNLTQMLQTIAARLGELWNAPGCYLWVWDEAHPERHYCAAYGTLSAMQQASDQAADTFAYSLWQVGRVVAVEDVVNSPYAQQVIHYPVRALLVLPLMAQNERLGVALIGFNYPRRFSRDEIERGEQAARHIALAIAKMYALEAERQRTTELETIRTVGLNLTSSLDLATVLDNILTSVFRLSPDVQDAHIYFYRDEHLEFAASRWADGRKNVEFAAPRPHGLTNTVARYGEMIVITDPTTHPLFADAPHLQSGAMIGLPLKIGTRVVGVMNVAYREKRHFPKSELRTLELLASQAAIAIENARLFDETKQRAERMSVLNEIARAITATLNLPQLYRTIHQQTQRILTAEAFFIALYDERYNLIRFPFLYDDGVELPSRQVPLPVSGPVSYVIRTRAPYVVNRPTNHVFQSGTHFGSPDKKAASAIYVPLMLGTQILGVLSVQSYRENSYRADDVQVLQIIANQAAIALENARLYNEVQQLATIDELTGVFNRRGLFQLAQREVERALRYHRPLAAMMLDIDCFKSLNDTYGHPVGDRVLRSLADRCRENLRTLDIVGRYGGEEFFFILPETRVDEALLVAERLRRAIGEMRIVSGEDAVSITVSIGVAAMTPDITDLTTLIEHADRALYLAKQDGRNCVRKFD